MSRYHEDDEYVADEYEMEDLDDNMDYETNDRDIGSDFDGDEYEYMVGWIYGSLTEDILTGFKMHCHGRVYQYIMFRRGLHQGFCSH
ncbi:putative cellulose synthase (UDP-forming) [Helianthus annuus]|uniref:Cellulose synthase (UDP-forming) n=2 Tax=Helianthus annuus TaxID=4232 RepID=A0A9K3N2F6_HELAN|nr:putative cellulose synthase (UDP-forming) [Helianthus annuus]KAJ0882014.1 putative cellulose synthase (UDP-forming) [Helianthus annuus]